MSSCKQCQKTNLNVLQKQRREAARYQQRKLTLAQFRKSQQQEP